MKTLNCPNCAAPLDWNRVEATVVECAYCNHTLKLSMKDLFAQSELDLKIKILKEVINDTYTLDNLGDLQLELNIILPPKCKRYNVEDMPSRTIGGISLQTVLWARRHGALEELAYVLIDANHNNAARILDFD